MEFRILDLFCGAGGFSLGFEQVSNFKTVLANDISDDVLKTFAKNFPNTIIIKGDILNPLIQEQIIEKAKELKVNMIIGGPPCQGFSNKGKKLGLKDPRNFLFLEYLKLVKAIRPKIFIIENVKTLLSSAKGFFIEKIRQEIEKLGYFVNYDVLNSYNYGIPQIRERAIIIAFKEKMLEFPKKYSEKVSVFDAISDLSYLESNQGEHKATYLLEPKSQYQQQMRLNSPVLYNHKSTNHSKIALEKLTLIPKEKGKEFLPKEMLGKQKFKTTWGRLKWDQPSPTIDTRFDTPSNGTNSHPVLNRSITPREAARLQSFPDNFEFLGTKTSICKQIGNAVPPLLSKSIALSLILQLSNNNSDNFANRNLETKENLELYNDDALEIINDFLDKKLKVDHIITDPPYNISQKNSFSTLNKNTKRNGIDFGIWDKNFDVLSWISKYAKLVKSNGSFIVFCSFRYLSFIIIELEKSGFVIKDVIKWIKTNPMPRNVKRRYVQDTEYIIWAVRKRAKWIFNKPENVPYLKSFFSSSVVLGKNRTIHPTQKSLELMEFILKVHTNENQIVLDPFMGSGTTGVAALKLNRKFIGIEKDENYFEIAKVRLLKQKV
ncbi:cytosine-specific methyltransferase [Mesomycoplasma dispar]|uniref:DNA (cytosine-5-)-methyltransferase n=1 Tax=Mesomycoplasma dispar TaxID=86660 RepID=A0AAJ5NM76_9BACT|nr:DNA (cytosine-5-)-methyltransferase [Mesomycoplasma dispar]VEU62067.1 cytosine-specific methyltransferase [Mesomycoplasma dispar]